MNWNSALKFGRYNREPNICPCLLNYNFKWFCLFLCRTVHINEESHGLKVVEYFLKHDGLLRLEEYWRNHFLESMEPRYMPALWSTKHNEERWDSIFISDTSFIPFFMHFDSIWQLTLNFVTNFSKFTSCGRNF